MSVENYNTAFLPSKHGFHFNNRFSSEDIVEEASSVPPELMWNDNNWGLCGGMCFASLDRFFNGIPVPENILQPPEAGTELFQELVARELNAIESADLSKICDYQRRADDATDFFTCGHTLGHYTKRIEYLDIRQKLMSGIPVTICLIRGNRWSGFVSDNHMVIAYGLTVNHETNRVTINVYDPNHKNKDDVTVGFTLGLPDSQINIFQSTGEKLRGFIYVPYDRQETLISPDEVQNVVRAIPEDLSWLGALA